MTAAHNNRFGNPAPEELAAYADGELSPLERARVEAWLLGHPEAQAEVEAQRRLLRLWQNHQPPEPSAAAWESVRSRLQAILPNPRVRRSRSRLLRSLPWLVGLAAAAALAVFLARSLWTVPAPEPPKDERQEALSFPMAEGEDVTIISMDVKDAGAVLVEHPPLLEEGVQFATAADIDDVHMQPAPGGLMPRLSSGEVPMVVAAPEVEPRAP